ncbi:MULTISPECIES: pyrimidine 5'-nucleotidase [unclassified Brevundimonas]|uniref:pyrimidine 5'-nucleotidase n=1 Tax=unclassified Brevundimonas TaxID=2622653 RepID=UPI0006F6453B|nr:MULTISPECIES: pyrimidine 5'-nucleotidase [unclassified Brevundimonas]KQY69870.1 HAD family hydrolase [Brevundimonas sp. Root1423]KRA27921.1 HAD family hydrolase [Brevundimonas sp. Root608]
MTAEAVEATEFGADLRHVRSWIFDLDDTLYPPESQFMRLIQQRINDYVVRTSGLPADEAMVVQKGYLNDYGTSLAGLMAHHEIDPHDFLAEVHDVPLDVLTPDPGLRAALERLDGPRIVFTNGSTAHARRVIERLQLADLFDGLFSLEDADLIPKPDPRTFARMAGRFGIAPASAAFFEDTVRNLEPAHALGMTTVLVGTRAHEADIPFVDHRAATLGPFLATARLPGDA